MHVDDAMISRPGYLLKCKLSIEEPYVNRSIIQYAKFQQTRMVNKLNKINQCI